jgi:hypothetical protein
MEQQIRDADFVLMVCTPTYLQRVEQREEPGKGLGVLWEANLIINLLYPEGAVTEKFIPLLPDGCQIGDIPLPLSGHSHYRFQTEAGYEGLYRRLTGQPKIVAPALGKLVPMPLKKPRVPMEEIGAIKEEPNHKGSDTESTRQYRPLGYTRMFDKKRLERLEEKLDLKYEKLHEYEIAIEKAAGDDQRISLRLTIKRDLLPSLRQDEEEYARLLADCLSVEGVPEAEANQLVTALSKGVAPDTRLATSAPEDVAKALQEIREVLAEPGKSATAKLKVSLPPAHRTISTNLRNSSAPTRIPSLLW